MRIVGEATFLLSILIISDRDEIKLRTNRMVQEFLSSCLPFLTAAPLATHHQTISTTETDSQCDFCAMPLVMSGIIVGSLCFFYGNNMAKWEWAQPAQSILRLFS